MKFGEDVDVNVLVLEAHATNQNVLSTFGKIQVSRLPSSQKRSWVLVFYKWQNPGKG